jgi:hypothetical protein
VSELNTAQRKALPLSSYAWPAKRLYPVVDASDMQGVASLLGKAPESVRPFIKRRAMAIARRKGFADAIPQAWLDEEKGNK